MIEFHSIGSMLILLISNVAAFFSSTFKQCIMVHGMLKWAIKHGNADE